MMLCLNSSIFIISLYKKFGEQVIAFNKNFSLQQKASR